MVEQKHITLIQQLLHLFPLQWQERLLMRLRGMCVSLVKLAFAKTGHN